MRNASVFVRRVPTAGRTNRRAMARPIGRDIQQRSPSDGARRNDAAIIWPFLLAIAVIVVLVALVPRGASGAASRRADVAVAPRLAALSSGDAANSVDTDLHFEPLAVRPGRTDSTPSTVARRVTRMHQLTTQAAAAARVRATDSAVRAEELGRLAQQTTGAAEARDRAERPTLSDLVRNYTVRKGDSLASLAKRFDVTVRTIWASNRIAEVEKLRVGRTLHIPPSDGVLYTFRARDTLRDVARRFHVTQATIGRANGIAAGEAPRIGQRLFVPGGEGRRLPVKRVVAPVPVLRETAVASAGRREVSVTRRGGSVVVPATGSGMRWPVGGGSVSRGFGGGHQGLDIHAPNGTPVYAARAGRVTFAGWGNNGGGYQVWIDHGGGLYTTYNHLAFVSTGSGASVGGGQRIGGVGATGYATGPHLHFEVWIGPIWSGGYRVNPAGYL